MDQVQFKKGDQAIVKSNTSKHKFRIGSRIKLLKQFSGNKEHQSWDAMSIEKNGVKPYRYDVATKQFRGTKFYANDVWSIGSQDIELSK